MTKNRDEIFLKQVSDILETARKNVKTAVNLAMVYSYYVFSYEPETDEAILSDIRE